MRIIDSNIEKILNINFFSIILNYYNLVDSDIKKEYIKLYNLFDENIIYDRAGTIYNGKKEFEDFFIKRFSILNIKHKLEEIEKLGNNKVFVKGSFNGNNLKINQKISGDFIDIFTLKNGKIIRRVTCLLADSKFTEIIK